MDGAPERDSQPDAAPRPELVEGWFIYTIKQLELGLRAPLEQATQQAAGLTTAQYTALAVLARWPGITSSELARRSFVRAQTMAETMTPLLEAGYVHRASDASTGRRIPLFLTDEGREVLESLRAPVAALESELLGAIPPADRPLFASFLRTCRSALSELPR